MSGHGHGAGEHGESNKKVALLISVLALFLAISEILGQKAQTHTLQSNIEASNLWSFFQAKTIRRTVLETAADEMEVSTAGIKDPALLKTMQDRIGKWRSTAARYKSEPDKKEGSDELMVRATKAEEARDKAGKKHFRFELATGSFQIGIVLASAAVITGLMVLLWGAGGLGVIGLLLLITGMFA